MNLSETKKAAAERPGINEAIPLQITARSEGLTSNGKPYIEITVADASGAEKLRIWNNTPAYRVLADFPQMGKGTAIELLARWKVNEFGLNAEEPRIRALTPDEMNALFTGGAAFQRENDADWNALAEVFRAMCAEENPMRPIGLLGCQLLASTEENMRRAAAAHGVHHARRGGLLAHTASMMRVAVALGRCYPEIVPEILQAGVLFHDIGKIFETDYQALGFALEPTMRGALIGHISIGLVMLEKTWEKVNGGELTTLRDHIAHLILSHHGQNEWGSPVEPKTPEAVLLHHIDMMDAGVEKLRNCYREGKPSACPGLVSAVYPMRGDVGLPFRDSAAFARMHVSTLLLIGKAANEEIIVVDHEDIPPVAWYEERFCTALHATGITTEVMDYRTLTRGVLDTAFRRWSELIPLVPGLPALPQSNFCSRTVK
jgi:3'-5' exoribonuclease